VTAASSVLLAVAAELAELAKAEMPKLNDGEVVRREWYENGMFYRETALGEDIFICQYDFRQRKSRRSAV
jgi:hypothetical protein